MIATERIRYLNQTRLQQERLPDVIERKEVWNGFEARLGMADLRPLVLQRDGYTCQSCGISVPLAQAQVDHKRPVQRFKLPINANRLENLQTLCIPCHGKNMETDRQMESRIR